MCVCVFLSVGLSVSTCLTYICLYLCLFALSCLRAVLEFKCYDLVLSKLRQVFGQDSILLTPHLIIILLLKMLLKHTEAWMSKSVGSML